MADNRCVCCGEIIQEGMIACPNCLVVSKRQATEGKRLIDANALMDAFRRHMAWKFDRERCVSEDNCKTCDRGCLWRNIVMDAPTVEAVEIPDCNKCAFNEGIAYWHQCENCLGEARNNFVSISEVNKDG